MVHAASLHMMWAVKPASGNTLVELLIGMALGLMVIAGAMSALGRMTTTQHQQIIFSRLQQDLHLTAQALNTHLRRAGYGNTTTLATITCTQCDGVQRSQIEFAYERDGQIQNLGFRLSGGAMQMKLSSGGWQSMTDNTFVTVSQFSVLERLSNLPSQLCPGASPSPPSIQMRSYDVVMTAYANSDPGIVKKIALNIPVTNHRYLGSCG